MSDYLANLAARNIPGASLLGPRLTGIYEPPGLIANAWFGETTGRANFDPSLDGGLREPARRTGEDETKSSPLIPSSTIPAPEPLRSKNLVSNSDAPWVFGPPLLPRNDRESPPPEFPADLPRPGNIPLFTPGPLDLITLFQEARAETRERKAIGSDNSSVASARDLHSAALTEVPSSEIRNTVGPHSLPTSAESSPFGFQSPAPRGLDPAGSPKPTSSVLQNSATDTSPRAHRLHASDREEIAQEVSGEVTRGEASQSEIATVVRESVRSVRFHEPLARAEIADSQAEPTEVTIPSCSSAGSQHRRFEAIWRQPRAPVNSLPQMERVIRPGQREGDVQVVATANPTVQVTIGRIEVRASVPHVGGPARERDIPKVMGLDEYLGRRAAGSRK